MCVCVSASLWCNVEKEGGSEASGKINTNSEWCQQHLLDLHFLIAKEKAKKKKKLFHQYIDKRKRGTELEAQNN